MPQPCLETVFGGRAWMGLASADGSEARCSSYVEGLASAPLFRVALLTARAYEPAQHGHESRLAVGIGLFENVLQVVARCADADR